MPTYRFWRPIQLGVAASLLFAAAGWAQTPPPAPNQADISEVQYWLGKQGLYVGPVDGVASATLQQAIASVLKKPSVGPLEWIDIIKEVTNYKMVVGIQRFGDEGEDERRKTENDYASSFLGNDALRKTMFEQSGLSAWTKAPDDVQRELVQMLVAGSVPLPLRLTYREQVLAFYHPVFDIAIAMRWTPAASDRRIDAAVILSGEALRGEPYTQWAPSWQTSTDGYLNAVEEMTFSTIAGARSLSTVPNLWDALGAKAAEKTASALNVVRIGRILQSADNRQLQCGAVIDLFAAQFPQSIGMITSGNLKGVSSQALAKIAPLKEAGGASLDQRVVRYFVPKQAAHIIVAIKAAPNGTACDLTADAGNLEQPSDGVLKNLKSVPLFDIPRVEPQAAPPAAAPGTSVPAPIASRVPSAAITARVQSTASAASSQLTFGQQLVLQADLNARDTEQATGPVHVIPKGARVTIVAGSRNPEWSAVTVNRQPAGFVKNSVLIANVSGSAASIAKPSSPRTGPPSEQQACETAWTPKLAMVLESRKQISEEIHDLGRLGLMGYDLEPKEKKCARVHRQLTNAATLEDIMKSCPKIMPADLASGSDARRKFLADGMHNQNCDQ